MRWLGLVLLLAAGCKAPPPPPAPADASPPDARPAADAAAPDAGRPTLADLHAHDAERCADCHPDEVAAWSAGAMGRALEPVGDTAPPGLPAEVRHPVTGLTYRAEWLDGRLWISERALDGHTERRAASHAIGSGEHTASFLWQRGQRLFVAPLTRYAGKTTGGPRWDLSPGYTAHDHPGLFRTVQADCLHCHSDPGPLVPGSTERWQQPPVGAVGCARCHGDARAHADAQEDGRDAPVINPARLPPDRAAAVCEFCHLQGAVRLRLPGSSWADFRPGMALDEVVAVFVRDVPDDRYGIASHGVRLRRSACRTPSGDPLRCTTCHQPHGKAPDPNQACQRCHQAPGAHGRRCPDPAAAQGRCTQCHLSQGLVDDVPHTAATDHYIRRRPAAKGPPPPPDAPLTRVGAPGPPRSPADALLLGRAYAEVVRASGQPADLRRALPLLRTGLTAHPGDVEGWLALHFVAQLAAQPKQARAAAEAALSLAPDSPRAAAAASAARLAGGDAAGAVAALQPALAAHPDTLALHVHHTYALATLGQIALARAAATRALALQPRSGPAWVARAIVERLEGQIDAARATLRAAVARAPTHVNAWLNLGQLSLLVGDAMAARDAFAGARRFAVPGDVLTRARADVGEGRAVLRLGDQAAAARHLAAAEAQVRPPPGLDALAGGLAVARGQPAEARPRLEAAVRADPNDRDAWRWLAEARRATGDAAGAQSATQRAAAAR